MGLRNCLNLTIYILRCIQVLLDARLLFGKSSRRHGLSALGHFPENISWAYTWQGVVPLQRKVFPECRQIQAVILHTKRIGTGILPAVHQKEEYCLIA